MHRFSIFSLKKVFFFFLFLLAVQSSNFHLSKKKKFQIYNFKLRDGTKGRGLQKHSTWAWLSLTNRIKQGQYGGGNMAAHFAKLEQYDKVFTSLCDVKSEWQCFPWRNSKCSNNFHAFTFTLVSTHPVRWFKFSYNKYSNQTWNSFSQCPFILPSKSRCGNKCFYQLHREFTGLFN